MSPRTGALRAAAPAAVAAATARLAYAALRARPPGGQATWARTNYRSEPVTLLEGPAVAAGAIAGALAAGGPGRDRLALALAGAGGAVFGTLDDRGGNAGTRGFRGHVGALARGQVTTGAVKLAGIGVTGLAAALVARPADGPSAAGRLADVVVNAGLVAGGANLANLFDVRPGRAVKAAGIAGLLLAPAPGGLAAAAAPLAAAGALLPEDLGERAMLGDAGANALGAMLGAAAATTLPRPARLAALAAVVGLTAASEFVSFSRVIERTGPLRRLDLLGRRPASPAGAGGQPGDSPPAGSPPGGTPPGGTPPAGPHLAPVR